MSKPVLALVAMQLVQEGRLDLDRPLVAYLGHDYLPDQPDHRRITARMALTHRTGFANWRAGYDEMGGPLPLQFPPGSEYTYSGEGMLFLQRAVEAITGQPLDRLAQERLFAPLGLARTSFVWTDALEVDLASGHRDDGSYKDRTRYRKPNAAYSLYTTPTEYARLLLTLQHPELLGDRALTRASTDLMLQRRAARGRWRRDSAARPCAVRRDLPRAGLEPGRHAGRRHRRALRLEQFRVPGPSASSIRPRTRASSYSPTATAVTACARRSSRKSGTSRAYTARRYHS